MLDLELDTAPTEELVTIDELREQCGLLEEADFDEQLKGWRAAALAHLDGYAGILGRAICEQTWVLYLERFPCGSIKLPLPPLLAVTGITYVDPDGATQTLSTSVYRVLTGERSEVVLAYGQSFPAVRCQARAVAVTFSCGFAPSEAGDWPSKVEAIRAAVKIMVEAQFQQRDDWADPPGVKALLRPLRIPRI